MLHLYRQKHIFLGGSIKLDKSMNIDQAKIWSQELCPLHLFSDNDSYQFGLVSDQNKYN